MSIRTLAALALFSVAACSHRTSIGPDVDGGLVGGASLVAADFIAIIKALK